MLRKAGVLNEYRIWLKYYFASVLDNIERYVILAFQQEFSQYFQRWFGLLVDNLTKDARVDDKFTLIVEQDGYEQEVYYLSGSKKNRSGVKTCLEYSSAEHITSMESNLLILDEPTYGFRKDRMGKNYLSVSV
ncbi:MAG: hypothetical protein QXV84_05080 [Conexivisphaerales archaeon]